MTTFHDFLVKHARFPFPHSDELRTVGSTDISLLEVGLLAQEWKAERAVRDDALVQKLCDGLEDILGDTALQTDAETFLLTKFSPLLEFGGSGYGLVPQGQLWLTNPSEAHVSFSIHPSKGPTQLSYPLPQSRVLLNKGIFEVLGACLYLYDHRTFMTRFEDSAEGGMSKVDYMLVVDDNEEVALCEAKSPSVMRHVGEVLPDHGFQLTWLPGQSLLPKILTNVSSPSLSIITMIFKKGMHRLPCI